jgi:hypothetical protein
MDEIKGNAKQVKGAIKENLGWLTDDHEAEAEGKRNSAKKFHMVPCASNERRSSPFDS